MTMGVGAGQMSRLDSARIASIKQHTLACPCRARRWPVIVSVSRWTRRGGRCGRHLHHPAGGSVRDDEVIAANKRGIAMVYTGVRHFRH